MESNKNQDIQEEEKVSQIIEEFKKDILTTEESLDPIAYVEKELRIRID